MKVRLDYVTNSSSSSFIALNKNDYSLENLREQLSDLKSVTIGEKGNKEFGRFLSVNEDFFSKLNFLAISILGLGEVKKSDDSWLKKSLIEKFPNFLSENYKEILNRVIYKILRKNLNWKLIKRLKIQCNAYIDHQSIFEGLPEILKDEESLKRFLFNDKSVVVFDSDESGCCFQLLDKYFIKNNNFDYIDEYLDEETESGFYLFCIDSEQLKSEILLNTEEQLKEEIIRKQLRELLLTDINISKEIIEIYFKQIEIYRIDRGYSGKKINDWYEEYVFNNKTCLKGILERISEMSLKEYREELRKNQKRLKREIEEKLSENTSIWLITNPYIINLEQMINKFSNKKEDYLEEIDRIDKLFNRNNLFRKDFRLIYFEGF